ncbi:hypothetical protein NRIC_26180 [Enterococcus florum]|uniref:VWFA domain-containing protein n=1 Tax=Enterococcus florum TaxID=2480627 RepID=A0A4P5P9H5_9ENTE|nr:SpaA isopeptide-forming pilin-related protein [Enterococcus florum]GCF94727.1 hypothetical protein NRIC_26180 [Enterococcus florum]
MKKLKVLLSLVIAFSFFSHFMPIGIRAFADTAITLISEDGFSLTYKVEEQGEVNHWHLVMERESDTPNKRQRAKFKCLDAGGQPVEYQLVDGMDDEKGWLVEEQFSESEKRELTFITPQEVTHLQLYAQLEEERNENNEKVIKETDLNEGDPYILLNPKNEPVKKSVYSANAELTTQSSRQYQSMYNERLPVYTTDENGTYPEHHWIPEGQTNVRNHQGMRDDVAGWDGVESWDTSQSNFSDSYFHYGSNDALKKENLSIRKMAMQTANPEEFDIQLNVRGNINYEPGVDIMFILDASSSMNTAPFLPGDRKGKANVAMKSIIDELVNMKTNDGANIRVGGVIFGTDVVHKESVSATTSKWTSLAQTYKNIMTQGQTFTQKAIQVGSDLLETAGQGEHANRKKMMFVLTDGAPTKSWNPVSKADDTAPHLLNKTDPVIIGKFDQGSPPNYKSGQNVGGNGGDPKASATGGSYPNQFAITSHITLANSTAYAVKQKGVEIHTLAVAIEAQGGFSKNQLLSGLARMATRKTGTAGTADSDYMFRHIEDSDDLTSYVMEWYKSITRTVEKGNLIDPLSDMVTLIGNPTITRTSSSTPYENWASIEYDDPSRTIKVKDINLTRNQEYIINYKVKLNTDHPQFVPGEWYPANKATTLEPTPERSNDKLHFGVPSIKYGKKDVQFDVPVKKEWVDTVNGEANYWKLRTTSLTAVLQKQDSTVTGGWRDVDSLQLDPGNSWQGTFTGVEGGSENTYRVIEKVNALTSVPGYTKNISGGSFTSENVPTGGIVITNTLMTTDASFKKVSHDGTTPFDTDKPKFKLTKTGINIVAASNVEPGDDGTVSFQDLPLGSYEIEETYVPKGHKPIGPLELVVAENADKTGLVTKIEEQENYVLRNELQDFSIEVNKVDERGNPLRGASFTLSGPNSYSQELNDGPSFDFSGLKPGDYTLTESQVPYMCIGMEDAFHFTINQDGSFTADSHSLVTISGGITDSGNKLTIHVKNFVSKPMPSTGGNGISSMLKVSALFAIVGSLIGVVYWSMNRRKCNRSKPE